VRVWEMDPENIEWRLPQPFRPLGLGQAPPAAGIGSPGFAGPAV